MLKVTVDRCNFLLSQFIVTYVQSEESIIPLHILEPKPWQRLLSYFSYLQPCSIKQIPLRCKLSSVLSSLNS